MSDDDDDDADKTQIFLPGGNMPKPAPPQPPGVQAEVAQTAEPAAAPEPEASAVDFDITSGAFNDEPSTTTTTETTITETSTTQTSTTQPAASQTANATAAAVKARAKPVAKPPESSRNTVILLLIILAAIGYLLFR